MAEQPKAYAISVGGELRVSTVHSHMLGAIVNWLGTECGFMIMGAPPPEKLLEVYKVQAQERGAKAVCVDIVISAEFSEAEVEYLSTDHHKSHN